jgi:hypothetical protein
MDASWPEEGNQRAGREGDRARGQGEVAVLEEEKGRLTEAAADGRDQWGRRTSSVRETGTERHQRHQGRKRRYHRETGRKKKLTERKMGRRHVSQMPRSTSNTDEHY